MRQPGCGSRALAALLVAGSATIGCERATEPIDCARPQILRSSVAPNPRNVISAVVAADASSSDSVAVRFRRSGDSIEEVTPATRVLEASTTIPVLGLQEKTQYDFHVVAFNECGTSTGETLSFSTAALPSDLPRYSAAGSDPSPGYVAFAAGNYGIVIDNTGRIVWYHRFPNGPGLNFQPQPNGRYVARPAPAAGEIAQWTEIDPLGNTTRTLGCGRGLPARLHDMIALANGSYWLLCDEVRAVDLSAIGRSAQSLVLGTVIQHVDPAKTVAFDWSAFDHLEIDASVLEAVDPSGSVLNWTHGNSIDLDADGNVLVSFRNLSEVAKIDARTGAVVWRMGGLRNQFSFENASPGFARQHGVRATGAGRLQLLDNLGDPLLSRAERYEYDENLRTVRQSSSYASSSGVVAQIGGTTQSLPGGRMLVSFGNGGSVEETDPAGNIVWQIKGNPGYVFRAQRISSLYRPGAGDPR